MFEIHINQEVQFLTHVFVENRQRRSFLKNLKKKKLKLKVSKLLRNDNGFQI